MSLGVGSQLLGNIVKLMRHEVKGAVHKSQIFYHTEIYLSCHCFQEQKNIASL